MHTEIWGKLRMCSKLAATSEYNCSRTASKIAAMAQKPSFFQLTSHLLGFHYSIF